MNTHSGDSVKFEGEESGAGYASPNLDLIAAVFLVALSVVVMIASWKLPVPGNLRTAPGLLPFLTAASLLVMALMLAATAIQRRKGWASAGVTASKPASSMPVPSIPDSSVLASENLRTLLLMLIVGVYIAALQMLAFQYSFSIGDIFFNVSAFEPVTITTLAVIIHMSWRGPLWITTLTSILWTLFLSLVFQKAFNIPLPGSF